MDATQRKIDQYLSFAENYDAHQDYQYQLIEEYQFTPDVMRDRTLYAYGNLPDNLTYIEGHGDSLRPEHIAHLAGEKGWNGIRIHMDNPSKAPIQASEQMMKRLLGSIYASDILERDFRISALRNYFTGVFELDFLIIFSAPADMVAVLVDLISHNRLWRFASLNPIVQGIPYHFYDPEVPYMYETDARKMRGGGKYCLSMITPQERAAICPSMAMVYFLIDILPPNLLDTQVIFKGSSFKTSVLRHTIPSIRTVTGYSNTFSTTFVYRAITTPNSLRLSLIHNPGNAVNNQAEIQSQQYTRWEDDITDLVQSGLIDPELEQPGTQYLRIERQRVSAVIAPDESDLNEEFSLQKRFIEGAILNRFQSFSHRDSYLLHTDNYRYYSSQKVWVMNRYQSMPPQILQRRYSPTLEVIQPVQYVPRNLPPHMPTESTRGEPERQPQPSETGQQEQRTGTSRSDAEQKEQREGTTRSNVFNIDQIITDEEQRTEYKDPGNYQTPAVDYDRINRMITESITSQVTTLQQNIVNQIQNLQQRQNITPEVPNQRLEQLNGQFERLTLDVTLLINKVDQISYTAPGGAWYSQPADTTQLLHDIRANVQEYPLTQGTIELRFNKLESLIKQVSQEVEKQSSNSNLDISMKFCIECIKEAHSAIKHLLDQSERSVKTNEDLKNHILQAKADIKDAQLTMDSVKDRASNTQESMVQNYNRVASQAAYITDIRDKIYQKYSTEQQAMRQLIQESVDKMKNVTLENSILELPGQLIEFREEISKQIKQTQQQLVSTQVHQPELPRNINDLISPREQRRKPERSRSDPDISMFNPDSQPLPEQGTSRQTTDTRQMRLGRPQIRDSNLSTIEWIVSNQATEERTFLTEQTDRLMSQGLQLQENFKKDLQDITYKLQNVILDSIQEHRVRKNPKRNVTKNNSD